jgi:heat shock protein HslJ
MKNRRLLGLLSAVGTIGFVIIVAIIINSSDDDGVLDGEWTVQAVILDGEETPVIAGTSVTATFDAGALSGSAGCNNFNGSYETDGTSLTIGPLASTSMFCADPTGTMDQETAYLALLTEAQSFSVSGDDLEIGAGDGRRVTLTRN